MSLVIQKTTIHLLVYIYINTVGSQQKWQMDFQGSEVNSWQVYADAPVQHADGFAMPAAGQFTTALVLHHIAASGAETAKCNHTPHETALDASVGHGNALHIVKKLPPMILCTAGQQDLRPKR